MVATWAHTSLHSLFATDKGLKMAHPPVERLLSCGLALAIGRTERETRAEPPIGDRRGSPPFSDQDMRPSQKLRDARRYTSEIVLTEHDITSC